MQEGHVFEAAAKLATAMNMAADSNLPEKLAGIVKLHAGLAVASALIPIPGADVAATVANIWTMYVRMNKELGLPFAENVVKSVAAGVVTNIGGAAVAMLSVGTLMKFVPVIGSVGGAAVMAATTYGLTIVSGIIYMRALTLILGKKGTAGISDADLKSATAEVMPDKGTLKDMIKEAKKGYEPPKK